MATCKPTHPLLSGSPLPGECPMMFPYMNFFSPLVLSLSSNCLPPATNTMAGYWYRLWSHVSLCSVKVATATCKAYSPTVVGSHLVLPPAGEVQWSNKVNYVLCTNSKAWNCDTPPPFKCIFIWYLMWGWFYNHHHHHSLIKLSGRSATLPCLWILLDGSQWQLHSQH